MKRGIAIWATLIGSFAIPFSLSALLFAFHIDRLYVVMLIVMVYPPVAYGTSVLIERLGDGREPTR